MRIQHYPQFLIVSLKPSAYVSANTDTSHCFSCNCRSSWQDFQLIGIQTNYEQTTMTTFHLQLRRSPVDVITDEVLISEQTYNFALKTTTNVSLRTQNLSSTDQVSHRAQFTLCNYQHCDLQPCR